MVDFIKITTRSPKRGVIEIYPKFIVKKSQDLMIRGGDFYAIWIEELGLWSTDENDALQLIDRELKNYTDENRHKFGDDVTVYVSYMWDSESGMIDKWHKYCQKQLRDSFHMLDETLIFSNTKTTKKDYASKQLKYPLEPCDISGYDRLMSILYSEDERLKIEWAIGSIITGESKNIEKFMVLYGAAGTGKSTVLKIIQKLFEGYYSVFDAKALGSSSNSFALEAFKSNPLVAIQHDGDLSRIEDNTRLNSLVSHEMMTVNEKFKSTYANQFKAFLFMGTNKPVKITDAKSGLIRRLIDVRPSGNKLPFKEYQKAFKQIDFELGGIASHCKDVYLNNRSLYDDYIPLAMMDATNDFYNFVLDSFPIFKRENQVSLKSAYEMYKTYCDESNVSYPFSKRVFKEELKNYFDDYYDRTHGERNVYIGFKHFKFEVNSDDEQQDIKNELITFNSTESIFDSLYSNALAQYANEHETPTKKWDKVKTLLSSIDTSKLHYVKVPENHIIIDFDLTDDDGNKSLEKNIEAASKFPKTYAELSKSGKGVHLHYIYTGDVNKLSRVYDNQIEIKVFTGNSTLRRKLTRCNDENISNISSGLPLKEDKKVINFESVKNEKILRSMIIKNLNKEYHGATKPSIDFINKLLDDAYNNDLKYDVSDLKDPILAFAANSTNQSDYCIKLVSKMKFKSDDSSDAVVNDDAPIVFFDIEIFKNLFVVCWKMQGSENKVVKMINPSASDIEGLLKYRLVGFNCRRYDNHILYAALLHYTPYELYTLSQKIISNAQGCFFNEAYNISYTDIYDYSSDKKSLKKWEIQLDIHHQELGLPWDKEVPEDKWGLVADYCSNDVIATEAVFNATQADFLAREILADVADMPVNTTTNTLTTKIIFGNDKTPQSVFNYRNMGDVNNHQTYTVVPNSDPDFNMLYDGVYPVFPGYKYEYGTSTYRGEVIGEGGYVYSEPGMYSNVFLLDIASMHPSSIVAENLFGKYTNRFKELLDARLAIKHGDFELAKKMLGGKLAKYLTDKSSAKDLAFALKIVINSVYGLTAAKFTNAFKDPRNIDNIVAKRGALFMVNLKHEIQNRGFTVAHIKTDSIKIPDATPELLEFIFEYGKHYGYIFEHEATYEKMCLVNDSVYIAKVIEEDGEKIEPYWTATGTQFAVPYVFKTLFSKEPITFKDMCETMSVSTAMYIDFIEDRPDVSEYELLKSIRLDVAAGKKITKKKQELLAKYESLTDDDIDIKISEGHNYCFVGKVGSFCPIKPNAGGGILLRQSKDKKGEIKYDAVNGSKGYLWMESEACRTSGKKNDVNKEYYNKLVNEAVDTISKYGDFEYFVA